MERVTLSDVVNAPNILHTCSVRIDELFNYSKNISIYFQSYKKMFENNQLKYEFLFLEIEDNSVFRLLKESILARKKLIIDNINIVGETIKSEYVFLRNAKISFYFDVSDIKHYVKLHING